MKIASVNVDPQKGFTPLCPDELPVPGGDEIVPALLAQNALADFIVGSSDSHCDAALFRVENDDEQFQPLDHPDTDCTFKMHCNPGNASGPVSGYSSNVGVETMLRNQHFALQRGADQGVYVPSSNSTLYKTTVVSRPSEQPYPMLFKQEIFSQAPHPNVQNTTIGTDRFFNHTRTQLRQ